MNLTELLFQTIYKVAIVNLLLSIHISPPYRMKNEFSEIAKSK